MTPGAPLSPLQPLQVLEVQNGRLWTLVSDPDGQVRGLLETGGVLCTPQDSAREAGKVYALSWSSLNDTDLVEEER